MRIARRGQDIVVAGSLNAAAIKSANVKDLASVERSLKSEQVVEPPVDSAAGSASSSSDELAEPEDEDLHQMTVAQLKDLAQGYGVELGKATTKQQIIDVIESSSAWNWNRD